MFLAALGRDVAPRGCSKEIFQVLWMVAHRTHPDLLRVCNLGRMIAQSGHPRHMFKFVLMGGVGTSERSARHARRIPPPCPWCHEPTGETWEHAAWDCPRWQTLRQLQRPQVQGWPLCLSLHGLLPSREVPAEAQLRLPMLQEQLVAIACALTHAHQENGGLAQFTLGPPIHQADPQPMPADFAETYFEHHLRKVKVQDKDKYTCLRCGRTALRKYRFEKICEGHRAWDTKTSLPDLMVEESTAAGRRVRCTRCQASTGVKGRSRLIRHHACLPEALEDDADE